MITSSDGTEIGWHECGEGPPAVLVHGASGDKGNWIDRSAAVEALLPGARTAELPGLGHLA